MKLVLGGGITISPLVWEPICSSKSKMRLVKAPLTSCWRCLPRGFMLKGWQEPHGLVSLWWDISFIIVMMTATVSRASTTWCVAVEGAIRTICSRSLSV